MIGTPSHFAEDVHHLLQHELALLIAVAAVALWYLVVCGVPFGLLVRIVPSPSLAGDRIEALYANRGGSGKRVKIISKARRSYGNTSIE